MSTDSLYPVKAAMVVSETVHTTVWIDPEKYRAVTGKDLPAPGQEIPGYDLDHYVAETDPVLIEREREKIPDVPPSTVEAHVAAREAHTPGYMLLTDDEHDLPPEAQPSDDAADTMWL